jgi:hypothetical protein
MINTVPTGVTLTDIVEPLPVKPYQMTLRRNVDQTFSLQGSFRVSTVIPASVYYSTSLSKFWNMSESDQIRVNFTWGVENGKACSGCTIPLSHDSNMVGTTVPRNETALWFALPPQGLPIDDPKSLSKFWFDVIQDGKPRTEDQDGQGFPLQTDVVVASSTCMFSVESGDSSVTNLRVDVAVSLTLFRSSTETILLTHNTG